MITNDELKKIAALAKLSLDGVNIDELLRDFSATLGFAAEVSNAPVSASPDVEADGLPPLRGDVVSPSLPGADILRNAGETRDGFFVARDAVKPEVSAVK